MHTKFHKDWFSHSKVIVGGRIHRQYKPNFIFSKQGKWANEAHRCLKRAAITAVLHTTIGSAVLRFLCLCTNSGCLIL
jgi:hypothetical protein